MIGVVCGGWRDCVQCLTTCKATPRSKNPSVENIFNKIMMLAFINMCLNIAKSSTLHEEQRRHQNITLQMVVCGCYLSH